MLVDAAKELLTGSPVAIGTEVVLNTAIARMAPDELASLAAALDACVAAHVAADRLIAGVAFPPHPDLGYSGNLRIVAVFAYGPYGDSEGACFVQADRSTPDQVTEPHKASEVPLEVRSLFGIVRAMPGVIRTYYELKDANASDE